MKKILIVVLLAALLMPLSLVLVGCTANKEYRLLENFNTAFNSVITSNFNTIGVDIIADVGYSAQDPVVKKLDFVYSTEGSVNLSQLINDENVYSFIDSFYNRMLDAALTFVYNYTPKILSITEVNISKKYSDKLYAKLDKFESELDRLSASLANLEDAIFMDGTSATMGVCLSRLTNLYEDYEGAIESACQLSYCLSDIYFDFVLQKYSIDLRQQDFGDSIVRLRASDLVKSTYYYYQLLYTDIFYRVNVKSGNIPTKIRTGEYVTAANLVSLSAYSQFDYISTRTLRVCDEPDASNMSTMRQDYEKNISALYNCDKLYDNELKTFKNITDKVSYYVLKNSATTLSACEQAYVNYIDNFLANVYSISKIVISNLIDIVYP